MFKAKGNYYWQRPENFLLASAFILSFTYGIWQVLLNNFVVERAAFTGMEIGILQSLREVPGFLAFTAVFCLLIFREQYLAVLSLALMSLGIAVTGFFPNALALYLTTIVMSLGFHYFEVINSSLTLQWIDKVKTPRFMGRAVAVRAIASLSAYAMIWLAMEFFQIDYIWTYFFAGATGLLITLSMLGRFQNFGHGTKQHTRIVLRKRYWLYYALVFLCGARRQIFVVFAAFMMVEKFGYSVGDISLLFIVNYVFNFLCAERIGKLIGVIGERNALLLEYTGLIIVFSGYAFVRDAGVAAALYVIDHLFFAFSIAINTYFQKVSAQEDIAATAGVSFTINHIAAVFIPILLGLVWIHSATTVFLIGAGFACLSLLLSLNIPRHPEEGKEAVLFRVKQYPKTLAAVECENKLT